MPIETGEKQGHREAMERMVKRLVDSRIPASKAEKMARESVIRHERDSSR